MAIHILWQPAGSNALYASFAPGADPYIYGPRLVQAGIPYWYVNSEFIVAKEAVYGSDRIGWVLTEDPDLGEPDGYGA